MIRCHPGHGRVAQAEPTVTLRAGAPAADHYEVAIIGGGPAGSATALSLLNAGVESVLLVEARHYQYEKVGENLAPDVRLLLRELGLSHDFLNQRYLRSPGHASSWGSSGLGYSDFVSHPLGEGWHIDRRDFEHYLAQTAAQRGAQVCLDCRLLHFSDRDGKPQIGKPIRFTLTTPDGPRTVTSRFAVDASGVAGQLARRLGARQTHLNQHIFVCGFFTLSDPGVPGGQTLIEACDYGWWYRARLPGRRLIAALACEPDDFRRRQLKHWRHWLTLLAQTRYIAAGLAGAQFNPDSLQWLPGISYLRQPLCGPDWLAVGDAAAAFDPLLGRGICKALADGARAGQAIAACLTGDDGPLLALQDHVRTEFQTYLRQRADLYSREQRWPHAPFWARRHAEKV